MARMFGIRCLCVANRPFDLNGIRQTRPLRGVVQLMSSYGQIVGDRGRLPEFVSVEYRKSSELTETEARCHMCNRRSIAPRQQDTPDFYQSEFSQIAGWSGVMHHLEGPRNGARVRSGESAKIIDTHDISEVGACNSYEMLDDLRIPIHRPLRWACFSRPGKRPANTKFLQIAQLCRQLRLLHQRFGRVPGGAVR